MSPKKDKIRLLTWNLWFDDRLQIERLLAVLSYIEPLQPDIIAFQELTTISTAFFDDRNITFSREYKKVRAEIPLWQWYWEGLYTRLRIGELSARVPFKESDMGRGLTILHLSELDMVIGCTHLESENEHSLRRQQFSKAIDYLDSAPAKNKILLGDTNIRDGEKLNDLLPRHWHDAWLVLKPDDPGYTVDSTKNPMGYGQRQGRLDRVYYSCTEYEPSHIQLVGVDPIKTETGHTFLPSDHFGLLVDFTVLGKE